MEDVRAYQLHLIAQKQSWSHINQVACALRFFYGITLGQKEAFERIVTGREPQKLPPVSAAAMSMSRLATDDPAHCRIMAQTFGVVHVLISSETTKHRLPQQTDQRVAAVLACARIGEYLTRHRAQPERVV